MIKKFQVEPVIIDAIQFEDNAENFAEIREWVGEYFYYDYQARPFVFLKVSEKTSWSVQKGDWIIKNSAGDFQVLRPIHMEKYVEML